MSAQCESCSKGFERLEHIDDIENFMATYAHNSSMARDSPMVIGLVKSGKSYFTPSSFPSAFLMDSIPGLRWQIVFRDKTWIECSGKTRLGAKKAAWIQHRAKTGSSCSFESFCLTIQKMSVVKLSFDSDEVPRSYCIDGKNLSKQEVKNHFREMRDLRRKGLTFDN